MKDEKMILVLEEGVKVHGVKKVEVVPWLIHALVKCFSDEYGPVGELSTAKRIIDVLMEAQMMERVNIMWDAFTEDEDYDDDDDEYEDD